MVRRPAGVRDPRTRVAVAVNLPWPTSTDRRTLLTRPLKPVPILAHDGRLRTLREPPSVESSPGRCRWTIATGSRQSPVRPDNRESSVVHQILHARPGNTSHDPDPNPTSSHLSDATFHCSFASSASPQHKQAAGSKSAHLQMISFEDWRRRTGNCPYFQRADTPSPNASARPSLNTTLFSTKRR
jgi:hypothetical protein